MTRPILLTSGEKSGRSVYEGVDTRPIRESGGSLVSSFDKGILELLGVVDQDGLVEDLEVDQHYMIFPDRGELVVQERIPIQDASALRERIVDPELVADPEIVPEPAD